MYSLTNTVLNCGPADIWCAYSVPDPAGGKWDPWRVRLLLAGRKSSKIDIDYISATEGYTINGITGWWKLEHGGSFFLTLNMKKQDDLYLSSTRGSKAVPYEEWASGKYRGIVDKLLGRGWDTPKEIKAQLDEWESLKDSASPIT